MRNISHHPRQDTLAAYAAGRLEEARSVVVASHLTMCSKCRSSVADFEAIGGACLETVEHAALSDSSMAAFWERAGEQDVPMASANRAANDLPIEVSLPLRRYLKHGFDNVDWRPVAPGLSQHIIEAEGYRTGVLRLLKIAPGVQIPAHTHGGEELTMILRGSYEDSLGAFHEGDFADLDDDVEHAPRATGDEPCICLIATNAPLVFKGLVGKVMQPFVGL
jgi:putative transcriptional regulator